MIRIDLLYNREYIKQSYFFRKCFTYISSYLFPFLFIFRTSLTETFDKTDHVLEKVHTWPEFTETSFQILNSKLRFQIKLEDLR